MDEESNKLILMQKFRDQLVTFLDEIIDQFPTECDFVLIRMFIKDQIPVHDILGRFIRDILPLKEHVEKREEAFFLNNTLLYTGGNISDEKINHFQELWQSDKLDADDRETIWTWMECFIKISDCYFKKYGYINGWEKIE
tara:strand:- start:211 stop:630 length:420 start_codon:yes stop_codon:yes gene_type:complete